MAGPESHQETQAGDKTQKVQGVTQENSSQSLQKMNMLRNEVEKDVPMCVSLPIEVISPDQAFPFLKTTLADLGIDEADIKERVVWVDCKRTQVRSKSGKLKEKEVAVLEMRVKALCPGHTQCQEVLYSTESHTDRLYWRSGITIRPWTNIQPVGKELPPVEVTLALDTQADTTRKNTE